MTQKIPVPFDLSAISFQAVDALSLAKRLLKSESASQDGRAARTLGKSKGLTTVLTVIPAGGNVGEHAAPGPVVIVPLFGTVTLTGGDDANAHPISIGQVLFVGEGQKHQVTAREDSGFLIIIGLQS